VRRRITLLVAATTSLVLLAFLVPLALLVRDVAATRAMAATTVRAQSLAPVVATGDRKTVDVAVQQTRSWSDYPLTVLWPDGTTTGAVVQRDSAIELAARGRSLTVDTHGGQEILVAVQGGPGGTAVIRSFVSSRQLRHGVAQAWTILALLGVGLLAFGLLVADRLARSLVRQITALARLSHRLSRGDLDARVTVAGPSEIRDVGAGLNHLAARIGDLLARERESAADLSHRLRTPLTALRLEAEALRDPQEAERLTNSVDALERTVTQLIKQTRQPARHRSAGCDAAQIVADRVAFWSVLADEQDRKVQLTVPVGPVPTAVGGEELSACIDALLGNVFAHTPEGTALTVILEGPDPAVPGAPARLIVSDDGPGFGRGDLLHRGTSTAASSGLGLDIARRTAESSGRTLRLGTSPAGGAQVLVELGTPP
jgi:signal transduction histidine kinase